MKPWSVVAKLTVQVVNDKAVWSLPNQIEFQEAATNVDEMSFKCPITGAELLGQCGEGQGYSPAVVLFYDPQDRELSSFGTCETSEFKQLVASICDSPVAVAIESYRTARLWWASQLVLLGSSFSDRKYLGVDLLIEGYQSEHLYWIFECQVADARQSPVGRSQEGDMKAEAELMSRSYKFQTADGRASYDREKERATNRRLSEELNKTKE